MHPRPLPKLLVLKALAAAAAVVLAAGACSTGDQLCPQGTDINEDTDDCPYGPQAGPKGALGECVVPTNCGTIPSTYTWKDDIFPLFNKNDADAAACTSAGSCHGPGGTPPLMPGDNEGATYAALTVYRGSIGRKYIDPERPGDSWIMCNLRNTLGKGMPKGGDNRLTEADVAMVEAWVCGGAKQDGMGTGTGGGGGGGGQGGVLGGGGLGGTGGTGGI
jgi:hypothetical protein